MKLFESVNKVLTSSISTRQISLSSANLARKPPKEEYKNNIFQTRKRTSEPFDRRWKWTPKLAEPYNIRGGDIAWTKLPFLHRGVQIPGYFDPKTKKFIYVSEMVPEIVVPKDLEKCDLKPYVAYNVPPIENEPLDAKQLYKQTIEPDIIKNFEFEPKQ